ncbi:WD40 repeat domain-containing protein [Kitasatospora sp. NPDC101235]|uniref:WD40 repeat domain-containing protein n=1 Tax=Kitasatospora sp. NPDC101235 TaxID=3364101 RepID=UPI0037F715DA
MPNITPIPNGLKISNAHPGTVWPIIFSKLPEREIMVISSQGSGGDGIRCWSARNGNLIQILQDSDVGAFSMASAHIESADSILAAATEDGVYRWNLRTGERLPDHPDLLASAAWDVKTISDRDRGTVLVAACQDHMIRRWDAASGELIGEPFQGHRTSVKAVQPAILRNGKNLIFSGDDNGDILCWDYESGSPINFTHPIALGSTITGMSSITPRRGDSIISAVGVSGLLRRWNASTGKEIGSAIQLPTAAPSLGFFEHGGNVRIVTSIDDETITQWDLESGALEDDSLTGISAATCSSDEFCAIATGTFEGDIYIHNFK